MAFASTARPKATTASRVERPVVDWGPPLRRLLLGLATELDETVNKVLGGNIFAQAAYGGMFMLFTFTCTAELYRHAVQWSRSRTGPIAAWPSAGSFAAGLALVMMPTMGIALVAAVLVRTGAIGVSGTSASDVTLTRNIFVTLLWHLVDAQSAS